MIENLALFGIPLANATPFLSFPVLGMAILSCILIYLAVLLIGQLRQIAALEHLQKIELKNLVERSELRLKAINLELISERGAWRGLRKFEIQKKVIEDTARSICSFYLVPHDGKPLPSFRPGQFLTFHLDIPNNPDTVRCYSLSNDPNDSEAYRVSIKKIPAPKDKPDLSPGLSSNYFHSLSEGTFLDIEAPAGDFYLDIEKDNPVVLIGGGIGLTPVYSMLSYIIGTNPDRETWFFYGVRNGDEHIWKEELNQFRSHPNIHIIICYSNPNETDKYEIDYDVKGRVSVSLIKEKLLINGNNYEFYLCGPPPMMKSIISDLDNWAVPTEHVHYEAFGSASIVKEEQATHLANNETYEIEFVRSGKTLLWDGGDKNIWNFAQKHGLILPKGCGAGNCGQCKTAIRAGNVQYPKKPSKRIEQGSCLTCCSVPKGDLKLDA